ncbi:uncharacterized protein [Rutidosis leptorrhynchoides]|uniref:uncharacterized protein n=1 Tax=Rutidosis leptorrhynchoides TaxID=125765 RepID=UPI003A99C3F6
MTVRKNLTSQIRDAQLEALKEGNIVTKSLRGLDKKFAILKDGTQYFIDRIWVPKFEGLRELVLEVAHKSRYSIHPGSDNIWEKHLPLAEFSYNNSYHTNIKPAPFKALYGRKFRSLVCWTKLTESQLIGPKIIHETTEKIVQVEERLRTARSHQKSYTDVRRRDMEFKIGDKFMLKVLRGLLPLADVLILAYYNYWSEVQH